MTTCTVRYHCVVCEVSNCLSFDLLQLERTRPISAQLREAVWDLHKRYDGVNCKAWELVCADVSAEQGLRDVRFVFLPQSCNRQRAISDALAEMDWERDGQYLLDRIEASSR